MIPRRWCGSPPEALVRTGAAQAGIDLLVGLAQPTQSASVRLRALNALTENLSHAGPAVAVAATAKEDGDEYVKRAGVYLHARLLGSFDPMTSNAGAGGRGG